MRTAKPDGVSGRSLAKPNPSRLQPLAQSEPASLSTEM